MTSPEIRYRRLLALYPRAHREEYGEEMLAVLMADGRAGLGTTLDLVRAAIAARFRATFVDQGWREAAFAVQLFGSILLLALTLRRLAGSAVAALVHPSFVVPPPPVDYLRAAAWAAALLGALLGLRLLGVAGAVAGLAGEIIAPARFYLETPAQVLWAFWIIVAAVVVVVASMVSVRAGRLRGSAFVGAAGLVLIGAGFAVHALKLPFDRLPFPPSFAYELEIELAAAPAVVLALIGVARLEPSIRRRVIACAVPVAAAFPLARTGFSDFISYNSGHPEATHLISPVQWAALVLIPLLAFGVAAELNRRLEESRFRPVTAGTSKAP